MVRNNKDIERLYTFDHLFFIFFFIAYADDTTFFLEKKKSIEQFVETFALLSSFPGLKTNVPKCEICELGPLKEMQ